MKIELEKDEMQTILEWIANMTAQKSHTAITLRQDWMRMLNQSGFTRELGKKISDAIHIGDDSGKVLFDILKESGGFETLMESLMKGHRNGKADAAKRPEHSGEPDQPLS
jgi:hypothetical protein